MYSNPYQNFYDPNLVSYLSSLIKELESKIGKEETLEFLNNNSSDIEVPMPSPGMVSGFFEPGNMIESFLNINWIQVPKMTSSGKFSFVFRRVDYNEVLIERVKEKLRGENTSSPEKENNWFPILIELTEGNHTRMICNVPEEIPLGTAFRIIKTNY